MQKTPVLVNETTVEVVKLLELSVPTGFKLLLALRRVQRNRIWHQKFKEEMYRI